MLASDAVTFLLVSGVAQNTSDVFLKLATLICSADILQYRYWGSKHYSADDDSDDDDNDVSDGKVATQLAKDSDIHVITGLLKLYLRELPESLFTDALYPNLVTGMGTVYFTFLCVNKIMTESV